MPAAPACVRWPSTWTARWWTVRPTSDTRLNQALRESGFGSFDLEQVRAWIGDGPDVLIERALKALGQGEGVELRKTLRQAFDRSTLQAPLAHGAVFDGIHALLQHCGRPGRWWW